MPSTERDSDMLSRTVRVGQQPAGLHHVADMLFAQIAELIHLAFPHLSDIDRLVVDLWAKAERGDIVGWDMNASMSSRVDCRSRIRRSARSFHPG